MMLIFFLVALLPVEIVVGEKEEPRYQGLLYPDDPRLYNSE